MLGEGGMGFALKSCSVRLGSFMGFSRHGFGLGFDWIGWDSMGLS